MNKYEKKLQQILTLHIAKQPVSAMEKEQELRQELIGDVANGDADALDFVSKYKINLNDKEDETPPQKQKKEDSKFFKWLEPFVNKMEEIFYITILILLFWVLIYAFFLWG
jgi:hypothetical protein